MMKKRNGILTGLIAACAACVYLIDDARGAVDFHSTHLGFTVAPTAGAITDGRARALVAVGVGLISLVIGGLALARSAGRIGAGNGRAGAIVALAQAVAVWESEHRLARCLAVSPEL